MSVFEAFHGITLNGRWHTREDIRTKTAQIDQETLLPVIEFLRQLLDHSEYLSVQTSGSTGAPKTWSFPKTAFYQSALATNTYFGLHAEKVALLALPMDFIAAKMMVVRALIGQFPLHVVQPKAKPIPPNSTFDFVPMTAHQFLTTIRDPHSAIQNVRTVLLGGSPPYITDDQLRSLPNTQIYCSFGMTETLSHIAIAELFPGQGPIEYKPLQGVKISTSPKGKLLINWTGITDGWLHTNDLIEQTTKGFIWLGRSDFTINSGGLKIHPEEIEQKLSSYIEIPFFLYGLPDPILGERLVLFVESDNPIEINFDLIENKFHRPKEQIYLPRFERSKTGKILRKDTVQVWEKSSY